MIVYSSEIFQFNKYFNIYTELIETANSRNKHLTKNYEKHHILPLSIFPEFSSFRQFPWNCAKLTYREHFVAHWLLSKCMIKQTDKIKMLTAISKMAVPSKTTNRKITSWQYEKSKKAVTEAKILLWNDHEFKSLRLEQMNTPDYKTKRSQIATELWTNSEFRGIMLKIKNTEEYKQKQSKIQKDAQSRPDVKEKKSQISKENWSNPEIRKKYLDRFAVRPNMWENPSFVANNTFYCECCNKEVRGKGNWHKHLNSIRHKENLNSK